MASEMKYEEYAEKKPTPLQVHFAEWLPEVTGVDPSGFESTDEAFAEGVRLAVALRMEYQRSPENRQRTAAEREEREEALESAREERSKARAEREEAAEAKRAERDEAAKARQEERERKAAEREAAAEAKAAKLAAKKSAVADEDVDEDDEDETPRRAKVTSKPRPGARTKAKVGGSDPF